MSRRGFLFAMLFIGAGLCWSGLVWVGWLAHSPALWAQRHDRALVLPHRPVIKLIGFFQPEPPKPSARPVLTLAFPDDDTRYTFVMTDMKILAGPLKTPGAILDEVRPFTPNFYVRLSPTDAPYLTSATPAEQVTILAEYVRADRSLLVTGFEKSEEPKMH